MNKKIAPDKWRHFWVGIPLGLLLQWLAFAYLNHSAIAILVAVVLLVAICYGFELFSLVTKLGHYDIMDALAGIIGGMIGVAVIVILKLFQFI